LKRLEELVLNSDQARDAEPIIDHWRWRCQHPSSRSSVERVQLVTARLNAEPPHPASDLLEAIDGAALLPYVTGNGRSPDGTRGQRHDGLDLIFRTEDHLDRFRRYRVAAVEEQRLGVILRVLCLPRGVTEPPFDTVEQGWRFKCPVCRVGWDTEDMTLVASRYFIGCQSCVGLTHQTIREALL